MGKARTADIFATILGLTGKGGPKVLVNLEKRQITETTSKERGGEKGIVKKFKNRSVFPEESLKKEKIPLQLNAKKTPTQGVNLTLCKNANLN